MVTMLWTSNSENTTQCVASCHLLPPPPGSIYGCCFKIQRSSLPAYHSPPPPPTTPDGSTTFSRYNTMCGGMSLAALSPRKHLWLLFQDITQFAACISLPHPDGSTTASRYNTMCGRGCMLLAAPPPLRMDLWLLFQDITQFAACMSSNSGSIGESEAAVTVPGIRDVYSPFTGVFSSCDIVGKPSCGFKRGDALLVILDFSCSCLFISSNSFRKLVNKIMITLLQ